MKLLSDFILPLTGLGVGKLGGLGLLWLIEVLGAPAPDAWQFTSAAALVGAGVALFVMRPFTLRKDY